MCIVHMELVFCSYKKKTVEPAPKKTGEALKQTLPCFWDMRVNGLLSPLIFGCVCTASRFLIPCQGCSLPAEPFLQDVAFGLSVCMHWPGDWVLQGPPLWVSEIAGDKGYAKVGSEMGQGWKEEGSSA